jgi:hypothetical protein
MKKTVCLLVIISLVTQGGNSMALTRTKKLTDPNYSPTAPASEEAIRTQVDDSIQEAHDLALEDVTINRKLSATGDFTGTINGGDVTLTEPGLSGAFNAHLADNVKKFRSMEVPYFGMKRKYKADAHFGQYNINILGDSISQGYNSTNNANGWESIMRDFLNLEFDSSNTGFASVWPLAVYHTITSTGVWGDQNASDNDYLGLTKRSSTDATATLSIIPKKLHNYAKVAYGQNPSGGNFDIYVNGVLHSSVNGNGVKETKASTQIDLTSYSTPPTIEIRKTDATTTEICGIWYYNDANDMMMNNYSCSGAKLVEIPNTVIDQVTDANVLFFALGHNDGSSDMNVFADKIDYLIAKVQANKCFVVVMDFIWAEDISTSIRKQHLKRLADESGYGVYINANEYLFGTNSADMVEYGFYIDGSHPLDHGHANLAEGAAKILGLSVSSKALVAKLVNEDWHYIGAPGEPAFTNSWVNSIDGTKKYRSRFRKIGNSVHLVAYVKSGVSGTSAFTLPVGYRPALSFFNTLYVSPTGSATVQIKENGNVEITDNSSLFTNFPIVVSFPVD